jgi:hypothetical protein
MRWTGWVHQSLVTSHQSLPFPIGAVEFQELHAWGLLNLQAQVSGDLAQRVMEMWEMIQGHVAHEGAAHFIVSHAAVQPAEEDEELEAGGESDNDPGGIHGDEVVTGDQ